MRRPATVLALLALLASPALGGPRFREVSADWGLAFRHRHGGTGQFYMPETMAGGVVVFDYDGDGDQDIFFVDAGPTPGWEGEPPRSRLFRNESAGRFRDVTSGCGIVVGAYGMGATAGDVDGDGHVDLYVTAFGANQLFRNLGDGTFADVTEAAGVGDPAWSASAAFADVDGDGHLDLYVANYLDFTWENNPPCGDRRHGLRSYCHPEVYDAVPDRFYRNRGDGTFADATAAAGFAGVAGKGLGVLFSDLDGDGDLDLYVANDMTPNFLFRNHGDGTFAELGLLSGTALGDVGQPEAGMGVDAADLDGSGLPEILVTNLDLQTNALYINRGNLVFSEGRFSSRLAEPSFMHVGFGAAFADFDQDGDQDLLVANGHIIHNVELFGTGATYAQRNQLFENLGDGTFREVAASGIDVVRPSRGLAVGDLDGDGDLDAVVVNSNAPAEVYENVSPTPGGWLLVDLDGEGRNVAAVGARVEVLAGGRRQGREVRTASSYLSQSALTLHYGLGAASRLEALDVRWPGGRRSRLVDVPASRRLRLVATASARGPAAEEP